MIGGHRRLAFMAVALLTGAAYGDVFQGLGDLAGGAFDSEAAGISADGLVIVGWSESTNGDEAFRWTAATGMVGLGDLSGGDFESVAYGASADGSVIVGKGTSSNGDEAFRWTAGGGMVGIGDVAGDGFYSEAHAASANGTVVVGVGRSELGNNEASRWTQATGMVTLRTVLTEPHFGVAWDVSADGTYVVGIASYNYISWKAFRWSLGGGFELIGDLPGGGFNSIAYGVSSDGSVVVGGNDTEAYRWIQGSGQLTTLGDFDGGAYTSRAIAASGNGSVVVGFGTDDQGEQAFIWDADHGLRKLVDVLADDCAGDLVNWRLERATGISDDGKVIVGFGTNPDGNREAWACWLTGSHQDPKGCGFGVGLPGLAVFWCACFAWLVTMKLSIRASRRSRPCA